MGVDKLYLPDFRNLRDFTVDFNEDSPKSVLVGRNGVGKTNILEALTMIFRQLDLGEKAEFAYCLLYRCNDHLVEAESFCDSDSNNGSAPRYKMRFRVVGEKGNIDTAEHIAPSTFYKLNSQARLLPKHVFGYYSGTSSRLRSLFKQHTEQYRDDLINGREESIRPLFLAEDWHSQFVLLAFYAKNDPEIAEFLFDQFGIEELRSVLFVLNEPYWYDKEPSPDIRERGDERYWWAAGTVKHLLGVLHSASLAPMRTKERVPVGIRRHRTKEHSYCYLRSQDALIAVAEGIDQKEFFKRLESTVLSDLLREVRIRFRVRNSDKALTFTDLSEGEQQLLTVLGLLRFTNQDESLFLLDEPDTHLNPAWCLDYLDILMKYGGGLSKSHVIMTTHNPLVFAGLQREEVVILERRGSPDRIEAHHPASNPKGMGIAAILTSEFFGMRAALDRKTLALLDEKRNLGTLDKRSHRQEKRLRELNEVLRGLDFTNTVRDPLYSDFVKAMSELERAHPASAEVVLTPDALDQRRRMATEALKRVKP